MQWPKPVRYAARLPAVQYCRDLARGGMNGLVREEQVAMLHPGRCGSSVLGGMLNAHRRIYWAGELFEPYTHTDNTRDKDEFVTEILRRGRNRKVSRIFGFETKYLSQQHLSHRCINMDLADYITLLRRLGTTRFIVLHRKNYLRYAVSARVGASTKKWHTRQEAAAPEQVYLDVDHFWVGVRQQPLLELFNILDESYARVRRLLPGDDTLYLTYEDDILDDPKHAYTKVCRFLGLPEEDPAIGLRRTNPFSPRDIVVNFGEIEETLRGTPYAWMLED